MELKLKKPIEISLEYDDDTASLIEEREEKLTNGLDVTFTLDIGVEEKVLRGATYYEKDDVEVVISHTDVLDIRFFDGEEEVFLAEKDYEEMEKHIKESIEF